MGRLMTKPTKWHVRPAKTHISLGTRPVWSESSLSAWRKLGSLDSHWAHCEGSDQTGRMPRLIWVFAGRKYHFVGFVMRRLIWANGLEGISQRTMTFLQDESKGMISIFCQQATHFYSVRNWRVIFCLIDDWDKTTVMCRITHYNMQ